MTISLPTPTEPEPSRFAPLVMPRLPPRLLTLPGLAAPRVCIVFGSSLGMLRVWSQGEETKAMHIDRVVDDKGRSIRVEWRRAKLTELNAWEQDEMRRLVRWAKETT